jgi:glycosyltransferase involved in cell wall biosynthesis
MRILMLSTMYPTRAEAHSGIFVLKLAQALVQKGHSVQVIAPIPATPWPVSTVTRRYSLLSQQPIYEEHEGVPAHFPRYVVLPRRLVPRLAHFSATRSVVRLAQRLHSIGPFDLIHLYTPHPLAKAAGVLSKAWNIPYVVHLQGNSFRSYLRHGRWLANLARRALLDSTLVVGVGSPLVNLAASLAGPSGPPTVVINNGVNPEDVIVGGRGRIPSGREGKRILLTVANLTSSKRIDMVLRAFASVKDRFPDLDYVVVGAGEDEKALKGLAAALDTGDRVSFEGAQTHERVMDHMSAADVFVLVSSDEGFGVVYVEAMAHGLPVIGSLGEGIGDVIVDGQNGMLVPPGDLAALVGALTRLLDDPALARRLGTTARTEVLRNHTWAKVAERWTSAYEQALARYQSRQPHASDRHPS